MKRAGIFFILLLVTKVQAQSSTHVQDSSVTLSYDEFMEMVQDHHPLAIQANIRVSKGQAYEQKSKGAFDPHIFSSLAEKKYDDKEYYSLQESGMTIPTRIGLDIITGFEQNTGDFLNDQNYTPSAGLANLGVSVSLGKGLLMDERRMELNKARIFSSSTRLQRALMLNDLYLESGSRYWNWRGAYEKLLVYRRALTVAEARLEAVIQSVRFGQRAAVDTLEASILVQARRGQVQESLLHYEVYRAKLEVYLWGEGTEQLQLNDRVTPSMQMPVEATSPDSAFTRMIPALADYHPALLLYDNELASLEFERRWSKEQLKPTVDVQFRPLSSPQTSDPMAAFNLRNYTWATQVSFPVFLRKERGALKLSNLNIQEMQVDKEAKKAELQGMAKIALNQWLVSYNQTALFRDLVKSRRALFIAETEKFMGGESSLFMVNRREMSYIQSQIKQVDALISNRIAQLIAKHAFVKHPFVQTFSQ